MLGSLIEAFFIILGVFALFEILLRFFNTSEITKDQEILAEIENAIVLCRVEKINNIFYLYNSQDDSFVGQAQNFNDFVNLGDRLEKHIMVVDGDTSVVEQLKKVMNETSTGK